MGFLITAASFLLVLGIIIFVHEFGHFITAKAFGMRVFIFSFGFGRRLFGFKWGGTDCRVSLVPLGGYVKLEGEPEDHFSEDPALQRAAAAEEAATEAATEAANPNYFTSRPRWQRFLVYLAGPFMNAVLTVGVITVFHMRGFGVDAALYDPPVVGTVEKGSPAESAGLRPGDRILAIDGQPQPTWEAAQYTIALRPNTDLLLRVQRGEQELELPVRSGVNQGDEVEMGRIGVTPMVRVGDLSAGGAARQAGVQPDDGILRVGDTPVRSFTDIPAVVGASSGKPLRLQLWREGRIIELEATPRDDGQGPRLGIASKLIIKKFGFLRAVRESVVWTWDMTVRTFDVLKRLVTAQLSPRTIMGPLGIARASGDAARAGAGQLFFLVAAISLQVGILNLVPLAPLDGGHLAILAGESLARRDLSANAKAWIINAGALVLFALIGLVLYSDIAKTGVFQKILQ